ncbi:MAG: hypothetical protein ABW168_09190 [Sedimenticola sp.]
MTTYIVTFEVNDSARRGKLKEKMKEYGSYCPIHDNCWAIQSEQTPAQVREFLDAVLVANDRIFVIRTGTHAAWRNTYDEKNSEWLKERL